MKTSQDYSGRKVDLSLFPELKSPLTPAPMSVEGNVRAVAGPAKAAQCFLFALLGVEGERPGDPLFGTNFVYRMTQGSIRYPSDITQVFDLEASKAVDWWNSKSKARPADEQIKNVSLSGQSILQSSISLSITLVTLGGSSVTLLLPVKWNS